MIVYRNAIKSDIVKDATWIQGIGYVKGKPASEVKADDILVWNGGYTSKVLSKESETKTSITFNVTGSDVYDKEVIYQRKFKKSRIVAVDNLKIEN